MKKILLSLAALSAALLLSHCASTPSSRIAKNPQLFQALSPVEQNLVSQGHIAKGMPESGVFLAMGNPSRRLSGDLNGKAFTRWEYTGLQPVYVNTFSTYYGYGRYGHRYHGFGFGPELNYMPYRAAYVLFQNGQVSEWERAGH